MGGIIILFMRWYNFPSLKPYSLQSLWIHHKALSSLPSFLRLTQLDLTFLLSSFLSFIWPDPQWAVLGSSDFPTLSLKLPPFCHVTATQTSMPNSRSLFPLLHLPFLGSYWDFQLAHPVVSLLNSDKIVLLSQFLISFINKTNSPGRRPLFL